MSDPVQPVSPQLKPYMQDLQPGDYWWCACGRSKNQPFCDGSHKGSTFTPVKFSVTAKTGTLWLCGCKHTGTPPFCDGTHNKLARKDP
ncbi:MAG: CDGSH iron-sulfur domain-containing protein [Stenotrophobium sp.]